MGIDLNTFISTTAADGYAPGKPASFRGVPFAVVDTKDTRGRVAIIHEFPLKDNVLPEDMGRAKRSIGLTGFIVGKDYARKRDALMKACEEEGPGTLIHPYLGIMNVVLISPVEFSQSASSRGLVTFSLAFVEVPMEEPKGYGLFEPALALLAKAAAIVEACVNLDIGFFLKPVVPLALQAAVDFVTNVTSVLTDIYGAAAYLLPKLATTVDTFRNHIAKTGDSISAYLAPLFLDRDYTDDSPAALNDAKRLLALAMDYPNPVMPDGLGTSRYQITHNRIAIAAFCREMATISGLAALAQVIPESTAQAAVLRKQAMATQDFALENATSDTLFVALAKLGNHALRSLADAAKTAPEIKVLKIPARAPALALAWRAMPGLKDAEAAADAIAARNNIKHPGFVAPGDVEYLAARDA
jgi:prophage DNA circulation protein